MQLQRAPEEEPPGFDLPSAELDLGPRWPAWKTTLFLVIFVGAFWTGVGYLAIRLM